MIRVVAAKELRVLFASPLAWVVLAFLQLMFAWVFLSRLQIYLELQPQLAMQPAAPGATEVVAAPVFATASIMLQMVAPLLNIRQNAEDRSKKKAHLPHSAPETQSSRVQVT